MIGSLGKSRKTEIYFETGTDKMADTLNKTEPSQTLPVLGELRSLRHRGTAS